MKGGAQKQATAQRPVPPLSGLAHFEVGDLIHVAVVEVLARHAPDEHVVRGAGRGVDGPLGRRDCR